MKTDIQYDAEASLEPGTIINEGNVDIVIDKLICKGGFSFVYEGRMIVKTESSKNAIITPALYTIDVIIKELFISDRSERLADGKTLRWSDENNPNKEKRLSARIKKKTVSEAEKLQKLQNCSNIVKIKMAVWGNNTIYQVTEKIPNAVDFRTKLKLDSNQQGVVLPLKQSLKYIRQLANALREVHSKQIIHLDIKPENVLCDGYDNAILIDFGISVTIDQNSSKTTFLNAASAPWAPPEQYNVKEDAQNIVFATDIYSFGQTIYAFLTGVIPLDYRDVLDGKPQPAPSFYNKEVSDYLDEVVIKCIELRRFNRYQTMDDFLIALDGENNYKKLVKQAEVAVKKQQYDKALQLLQETEKYIPLTAYLQELYTQCQNNPDKERQEALGAIHNIYLVPLTKLTETQIESELTKVAQKINFIEAYNQKYPTHTEYYLLQQTEEYQQKLLALKERKEQERKEQERKEQERKEQERKEQERREQERREQERKEQERREQERQEQEPQEGQERREKQKKDLEAIQKMVLKPIENVKYKDLERERSFVTAKIALLRDYQYNYPSDYSVISIINQCLQYQEQLGSIQPKSKKRYIGYIIGAICAVLIAVGFFVQYNNKPKKVEDYWVKQINDTEGYDAFVYTGYLLKGQPNDAKGEAKYFKKGSLLYTYKGNFTQGERVGEGYVIGKSIPSTEEEFDYFIYTGEVLNDKANDLNGKGVYYSSQLKYPFTYEGGYKDNKRNGKGCETYAEADKQEKKNKGINPAESFCGNFKDDFPNGKLTIKFADGTSMTANYNGNYNPTNKKHYDKNGQVVNNQ